MIYPSVNSITSSIAVFEWARRRPEPAGELSWRSRPLLTREQALAAMVLAEIVAVDPFPRDEIVQGRLIASAGELGIPLEQAMFLLRRRSA